MTTTFSQDREFGSYFLGDIMDWVSRNMNPDDVFSIKDLEEWTANTCDPDDVFPNDILENWAEKNGWVKE